MKRFYTLALSLLASATALMAQTASDLKFVLINVDGDSIKEVRELNDGEEIACDDYDIFTGVQSHLGIKNVSDAARRVQLQLDITQLDNGMFSSCLGGSCKAESGVGTYYRPFFEGEYLQKTSIIKAGEIENTLSEWMCTQAAGKAVVKFTANVCVLDEELADVESGFLVYKTIGGPTVTAHFYNDPTGIKNVETTKADNAYYDLMGRKIEKPTSGIYIKNGKKIIK